MTSGLNRTFRQVTCKRAVSDESFPRGVLDFDFSIGGKTVFIPSRSYFRIGVELRGKEDPLPDGADVAFANFCAGNLFDNCYFLAGGQNVSNIVNYASQAHALGYSLKKSGAWLKSIGKDGFGIEPSLSQRLLNAKKDVTTIDSQHGNASTRYFMYQPPVGIMSYDKPMGAGDYRFQFNPNSKYQFACVETAETELTKAGTGETSEFNFTVKSMELYICTEMMDVSPTGTELLNLMEMSVQTKPMNGKSANLDFSLPPSTQAITVFVQSAKAGQTTLVPPSSFITSKDKHEERTLNSLQITYANQTKPPTRWTSAFDSTATVSVNQLQQRYLDTHLESGQAFSGGGSQTFNDWLLSPYYHYSWVRDANDRATQMQLMIDFHVDLKDANVFVVAHYSRTVQMSITNGYVTSVNSLSV